MNWVMQNSSFIGQLFLNHTVLIVPPLIVAFICAVLVGALGAQYPRVQEIIGGACQLLYTIPSLPLLVITPIFLGVSITSPVTVMVALGLSAVALLVRTSIDAFASVDNTHLQSAETLGYGPWRITFGVRCVLALPVLMAGLRVATMSTVSLASIGALVGVSSLGTLLTDGFQRSLTVEVVTGIIAIVAMALLCDAILRFATKLLTPWAERLPQ